MRYYKVTHKSVTELMDAFQKLKQKLEPEYKIRLKDSEVIYTVGVLEREKYSPQVKLKFEAMEDGTTAVSGTIGPDSVLWFLYVSLRVVLIVTFIIFCFILISKWYTNMPFKFELYVLGILAMSYLFLYLFGFINKKKGTHQLDAILNEINAIV